jgi:spore germination protein KC
VELNNRAFARIMLLDKTAAGIELTLGFPLPNRISSGKTGGGSSGGSSGEPFALVTKTGKNVAEAYRKMQADMPRRITFGQLRHILLGREFAEAGMLPFVDFLTRGTEIHINAYLFVTEGEAKQIGTIPLTFERFPTDVLTQLAREQVTVMMSAKDMLTSIYSGGDIILPLLVFGRMGAENEKNGNNWMGTDGAAIFKQGKMVGILNAKETRGAMWILEQLHDTEFDIVSPTDGKQVSFLVTRARTKIKPIINGNQIVFRIQCKGDATVMSSQSTIDVSDPVQLKRLESLLNDKLSERIDLAVAKSKSAQSDIFHFGDYIKWRHPALWSSLKNDWRARYTTDVRVIPQVDIAVKWFGAATKPEWNRILSNAGTSK